MEIWNIGILQLRMIGNYIFLSFIYFLVLYNYLFYIFFGFIFAEKYFDMAEDNYDEAFDIDRILRESSGNNSETPTEGVNP